MAEANLISARSLVRKLAEVMETIERVPKLGRNEHFRYDFVREADLVDAVRLELAQRQVIVTCRVVGVQRSAAGTTKMGAEKWRTVVDVVFTFHDGESGETLEVPFQNESVDGEDKGTNKAITAAKKYFLLTNFLVATGDDTERDDHDRPNAQPPPHKPAAGTTNGAANSAKSAPSPTGSPPRTSYERVPPKVQPPAAPAPTAAPEPRPPASGNVEQPPSTQRAPAAKPPGPPPAAEPLCAKCERVITEKVRAYSQSRFGVNLCFEHQKGATPVQRGK